MRCYSWIMERYLNLSASPVLGRVRSLDEFGSMVAASCMEPKQKAWLKGLYKAIEAARDAIPPEWGRTHKLSYLADRAYMAVTGEFVISCGELCDGEIIPECNEALARLSWIALHFNRPGVDPVRYRVDGPGRQ